MSSPLNRRSMLRLAAVSGITVGIPKCWALISAAVAAGAPPTSQDDPSTSQARESLTRLERQAHQQNPLLEKAEALLAQTQRLYGERAKARQAADKVLDQRAKAQPDSRQLYRMILMRAKEVERLSMVQDPILADFVKDDARRGRTLPGFMPPTTRPSQATPDFDAAWTQYCESARETATRLKTECARIGRRAEFDEALVDDACLDGALAARLDLFGGYVMAHTPPDLARGRADFARLSATRPSVKKQ